MANRHAALVGFAVCVQPGVCNDGFQDVAVVLVVGGRPLHHTLRASQHVLAVRIVVRSSGPRKRAQRGVQWRTVMQRWWVSRSVFNLAYAVMVFRMLQWF